MKTIIFIFITLFPILAFAQQSSENIITEEQPVKKTAINVGVLMGGGSLIGADFEYMFVPKVALQAGAGISSFGFGLNYHLKERINSSFISVQYMKQGFGVNHYATYIAPTFNFRLKKVFQAGAGFGYVIDKGPAIEGTKFKDMTSTLIFNIGVYFPL